MPGQIESALLIELDRSIRWEASLNTNGGVSGKLTVVDPNASFDATKFNRRDRELAYRDMINANAVVKVGLEIASIFGGAVDIPRVEGSTDTTLPYAASDLGQTNSQVVHIKHAHVPANALAVDMDLAGRDALLYDTLAKACQTFENPPLTPLVPPVAEVTAWSKGEAQTDRQDIATALPLNRDLFGDADKHLTSRDNQVAAYASRLCQVLKNPFAYATRLYVEIGGVDEREVEVYNLIKPPYVLGSRYNAGDEVWYHGQWWQASSETADVPAVTSLYWTAVNESSSRIWTAEPSLPDRNRIVYNVADKTLKWYRENNDVSSVPQLFALSVPGIFEYQTVNTLLGIPEHRDSQFWRKKAARIVFAGTQLQDMAFVINTTGGSNCLVADDAAVLTIPQNTSARWFLDAALEAGRRYQVSALVVAQPVLKVYGEQSVTSNITIADRGITFNGVHLATTLTPGAAVLFNLALPAGVWECTMDYTNLSGVTSGFGIEVTTQDTSQTYSNTVLSDASPLQFKDENDIPLQNGKLVTTAPFNISSSGANLSLSITWSYGPGLFHLRSITLNQLSPTNTRYSMEGKLMSGLTSVSGANPSTLDVSASPIHYGVMPFEFITTAPSAADNTWFDMTWKPSGETDLTPLMVRSVSLHEFVTNNPTPDAGGFEGYRQECLDRAEYNAQQSWNRMINGYGGVVPISIYNGTWSRDTTDEWISLTEIYEPRLREVEDIQSGGVADKFQYEITGSYVVYNDTQLFTGDTFYGTFAQSDYTGAGVKQLGAFKRSQPGHLGKLGLMPYGVVYNYQVGTVAAPSDMKAAMPLLVTLQPWMIEAGAYSSQSDFWLVDDV